MKFQISSSTLLNCLQMADKAVAPNNVIPILENILMDIDDTKMTIIGSNLDTTIITSTEIESTGAHLSIALPHIVVETVKNMPKQPIDIEINEKNLEVFIKSSTGMFNCIALSGTEYPQPVDVNQDSANAIQVPANYILTGVSKTINSTATEDIRPTMTGIYFDFTPEMFTCVATDAHKLSRQSFTEIKSAEPRSFILSKKSAVLLKSIVSPSDTTPAFISFDDKNIIFVLDSATVICRQIEGKYPNYNGVIPKDNPFELIIDNETLRNALKCVSNYSNQATQLIKFHVKENMLELTAQDVDSSRSGREELSCQYSGNEMTIGFRGPQVAEVLSSIEHQTVRIQLADSSRPAIFLPFEQKDNEDLLNLIMPMLIN